MSIPVERELVAAHPSFESGLLVEIVDALRDVRAGACITLVVPTSIDEGLDRWARLTGNGVVESSAEARGWRYVVRKGSPAGEVEPETPVGSRVWMYTNFDCNLACDYCCVRSSPKAARRPLGIERVRGYAREAGELGVQEIFLTGGEPFLLEDIGEIIRACAAVAPTTVLTNGMLFAGRRREILASLPRDRVTLQISLDSPTPPLHDEHRGEGTWTKAWRGVALARDAGLRVRIAATVGDAEAEHAMHAFLDGEKLAARDRVIRRVALRGLAREGVALSRTDLIPEVTITSTGYYWHPVGADDDDFFVLPAEATLRAAIDTVTILWAEERRFADTLASVFHCA